jgi:hypothetical protein
MIRHDWIGDLLSAHGPKPVILVEGESDILLYVHLLTLIDRDWRVRFGMESVDGKKRVFQGCTKVKTWRGLVDCDEWTEAKITEEQKKVANVQVLPRFAAENYLVNPAELWRLIPAGVRAAHPDAQAQITAAMEAQRADWTAHGAMWRVMLRRQVGLGDLGFPQELTNAPVTDEAQIMAILTRWHDHFKPEDVMAEYRTERDAALARSLDEQYAYVIHGKRFFRQVVTLALNKAFQTPRKTAEEWVEDLVMGITTVPADLMPLMGALLA